jgi:hypothetical protein
LRFARSLRLRTFLTIFRPSSSSTQFSICVASQRRRTRSKMPRTFWRRRPLFSLLQIMQPLRTPCRRPFASRVGLGSTTTATFTKPSTALTISRLLLSRNIRTVSKMSSRSEASRLVWYSQSSLLKAVTLAAITCGATPARPALTMAKTSWIDAGTSGASSGMEGTSEWRIMVPFSPSSTTRAARSRRTSKPAVLVRSLASLQARMTSDTIVGMKWSSEEGR